MSRGSLILREDSIRSINNCLVNLLKQSEAKCAILVDQDGICLAKKGFTKKIDTDALAALIAGSFSSTKAIANLIGETDFSILFHQGVKDNIHNVLVDDDTILSILFDDRTTIGMVRLYSKEAAKQLKKIMKIAKESTATQNDETIDINKEAEQKFDDIFNNDSK